MNCYVISAENLSTADVRASFPEAYEVRTGTWVAPSSFDTCADVAEELGMNSTVQARGIVVSLGAYYGYHNNALWEKINAWRGR